MTAPPGAPPLTAEAAPSGPFRRLPSLSKGSSSAPAPASQGSTREPAGTMSGPTPPAAAAAGRPPVPTTGAPNRAATAAANSGTTQAQGQAGPVLQPPQHRSDRVVMFLATLVTFPFAFLLAQAAAAAGVARVSGVQGGVIDTRQRLTDFPEGRALADIERWCREPVYSSWWAELAIRGTIMLRHLLLTFLPHPLVVQVLSYPKLLQLLGLHPHPPLSQVVADFMPQAQQLLAHGTPQTALSELRSRITPNLVAMKATLEARHRLVRGPTPLERLDVFTHMARTASRAFFIWLRTLARACTYLSSLLSVVSGALSFTVVPSIILSVISAILGVVQLGLMGTADLLEPGVNALLTLTETSKDTAASLGGTPESSPVCGRTLPAVTVEQMEAFFNLQLRQESGLLNRPEIPHLAGLNKPLLVKAYDLGLIDAQGSTESRFIAERLDLAESQNLMQVLWRALSRAAVAAPSFDVSGLISALQLVVDGASNNLLPGFLGGARFSLRHLFRPDGFFSYADDRQAQVATVLLARLLSWLHLSQVVAPGSPSCLRFVLLLGERQAGKATLFSRLVDAPPEYAAQIGGGGGGGGAADSDGTQRMGAAAGAAGGTGVTGALLPGSGTTKPLAATTPTTAATTTATGSGSSDGSLHVSSSTLGGPQPAVDMRQLVGQPNTMVVCFPGLHSPDKATRQLAQGLATAMGGLASAVVYLVHPGTQPSPDKLNLLTAPLAAGCHTLIAINGPSRVPGLVAGSFRGGPQAPVAREPYSAGAATAAAGPLVPTQSSPLESLRSRWQAAAEALCAARGLAPSLLGVVVSEVAAAAVDGSGSGGAAGGGTELPPGVHHLRQVQDWISTTAAQAQRVV